MLQCSIWCVPPYLQAQPALADAYQPCTSRPGPGSRRSFQVSSQRAPRPEDGSRSVTD